MEFSQVRELLDQKAAEYNQRAFITDDPVSIPHQFTRTQDIEIAGFFAAILAWGQRKTIISKTAELMQRMDHSPYEFVLHHSAAELAQLSGFKHRTFNDTDLLYFVEFFKRHYASQDSLETAFVPGEFQTMAHALNHFRAYFFADEFAPRRTGKHIASPNRKSACKRLNMYMRWMVRKDSCGVDFGLWNKIPMHALICPCDVHVERVARKLNLIRRRQVDWATAVELTESLKALDRDDPVRYDYALFGLGVDARYSEW